MAKKIGHIVNNNNCIKEVAKVSFMVFTDSYIVSTLQ